MAAIADRLGALFGHYADDVTLMAMREYRRRNNPDGDQLVTTPNQCITPKPRKFITKAAERYNFNWMRRPINIFRRATEYSAVSAINKGGLVASRVPGSAVGDEYRKRKDQLVDHVRAKHEAFKTRDTE